MLHIEVAYCEGWEPHAQAPVGMLTPAQAADRDAAGAQYSVLLTIDGAPVVVFDIAWSAHYCAAWGFDTTRQRRIRDQFRLLDGRLFGVRRTEWLPEEHRAAGLDRVDWVYTVDGGCRMEHNRADQGPATFGPTKAADRWAARPRFGDWLPLARAVGMLPAPTSLTDAEVTDPADLPDLAGVGSGDALPAPWQPPEPI